MAKKTFTYRGHTLEALLEMPNDEFIELLPSRARRKMKRGFAEKEIQLLEIIKKSKAEGTKKAIRTHLRDMIVLPEMVGINIAVYNGKEFTEFEIVPEMIGKYLAEFTLSRRPVKHSAPGVGATRSSLFVPIK